LRQVCGFDPFLGEKAVPTKDAFSRFLALLIEHESFIKVVKWFGYKLHHTQVPLPGCGLRLRMQRTRRMRSSVSYRRG